MIQFGIFVALLIAIALCFLLIPLWLKPKIVSSDDSEINIELAQKIANIKNDLANGGITEAQYESLKSELMLNLHRDLKITPASLSKMGESNGRWMAIPLGVFVPLLALAIYSVKAIFVPSMTQRLKVKCPQKRC